MGHKRVTFSGENLSPDVIAVQQQILQRSVRHCYAQPPAWLRKQIAESASEPDGTDLQTLCAEIERDGCLALLAAVEAAFRVDYLERVYARRKDPLSRAFRQLHQMHGNRLRLDEDILGLWLTHTAIAPTFIGLLRGVLNYRHWLAHGRYWIPKLGQRYDFDTVYSLAVAAFAALEAAEPTS